MIETPRLILRPWARADKPAFHDIVNTPAMMEFFGGVASHDKIDKLVDDQMAGQAKDGLSMWAVDRKVDGALVGVCGLRRTRLYSGTPVDDELEVGWRVGERYWGQGLAREAAQASLDWGFATQPDRRILAWVHPDNARSWGLMLRLGMKRHPELDFHHPLFAADDPIGTLIVYGLDRPIQPGASIA